jgi:hypothetical protein
VLSERLEVDGKLSEEVGAGGVPVLVRVMVNFEDKLLKNIGVLVRVDVARAEELISGISDVFKKVVEVTTDNRIEEPVRKIEELLVRELGTVERNDEGATEVENGAVFLGAFVDPFGEVLESRILDEEPTKDI